MLIFHFFEGDDQVGLLPYLLQGGNQGDKLVLVGAHHFLNLFSVLVKVKGWLWPVQIKII